MDRIHVATSNFVKAVTAIKRFAWRERSRREAVVIFGVAFAAFGLLELTDLPHRISAAVRPLTGRFDDLLMLLIVLGLALVVNNIRRIRDLNQERATRQAAERKEWHVARHDALTGLPNRRYLAEMIDAVMPAVGSENKRAAVIAFDLYGFKAVNDIYGRPTGDKALVEIAHGISAILDPNATLARIGGDEFAIILRDITTREQPRSVARIIVEAIGRASVAGDIAGTIGACIGIVIAPEDGTTSDALFKRADIALRRARDSGRSAICFFEPAMNEWTESRAWIERGLRAALPRNAIVPHYQPMVSFADNRIVGFEMLARWDSPDFGPVSPETFISIAEETGIIKELGDRLLRQACRDAKAWPDNTLLAVNLSARQLHDPTCGLRILSILADTGFSPRRLEVEITETAIVRDIEVARKVIDELREAGVRIALDDFGTGYATLSQLVTLRIDKIKLDRSFIRRLGRDSDITVIVRTILGLAQNLGLTSTAEGVEDVSQIDDLKAMGCREGQGFYFSRAVPSDEVLPLLRDVRNSGAA